MGDKEGMPAAILEEPVQAVSRPLASEAVLPPQPYLLYGFFFKIRGLMAGLLLVAMFFTTRGRSGGDTLNWTIGLTLFAAAFLLRIRSQQYLRYRLRERTDLATTGPYAHVRNPVYIANIAGLAALCIMCGLYWMVPIGIAWAALVYHLSVRFEEMRLARFHGEPYRRYLERVPRWIPRRCPATDAGNGRAGFWRAARVEWQNLLLLLVPWGKMWISGSHGGSVHSVLARLVNLAGSHVYAFLSIFGICMVGLAALNLRRRRSSRRKKAGPKRRAGDVPPILKGRNERRVIDLSSSELDRDRWLVRPTEERASRALVGAVVLLIALATLGASFGGPVLSDHEAIVAQCARNMRLSGDWVVPEYLGTPWFRKPPLPYWLIAAVSCVLPNDPSTGLPVSDMAARLPAAVSAFATVFLLWHLAASMFGQRVGIVAAVIAGSSLMFLLYGANATPEMLLTMCCTWAFVHFWHAANARSSRKRFLHAMLFYVAMGLAMLAKGPAPIAVTAFPLAVWWYTQRSLRILAGEGLGAWREAMVLFLRDLVPRTVQAFTKLYLLPGLIVFAAIFVPWMLEVAQRHPHAWNLWNWQYWQRAQGNYEDTRDRGLLYYPPMVVGLVVPWLFLIPEALASPWMKRYARQRRGLLFGGLLAVIGVGAMSLMQFKKPYYILPAVPGLFLLMAVVADRFFARTPRDGPLMLTWRVGSRQCNLNVPDERRFAWAVWGLLAVASVAAVVATGIWMRRQYPAFAAQGTIMAAGVFVIILFAGITFIRGHGWTALGILATTSVLMFHITWYGSAAAIDAVDEVGKVAALARGLDSAGVPPGAKVLWANRRPDARLSFYHNRRSTYLVTPEEIVDRMVDRTNQKQALQEFVLDRADALLGSAEPAYLILDRRYYDQLSIFVSHKGRLVASAGNQFEREGKHWVAVSNASTQ